MAVSKTVESRNIREGRFDASNNNFYRRKFSRRKQRRLPRRSFRPLQLTYIETIPGPYVRTIGNFMKDWMQHIQDMELPPVESLEVEVVTDGTKVKMPQFPDVVLSGNGVDEILKHANGETKTYLLRMGYPIPSEFLNTSEDGTITLTVSFDADSVKEAHASAAKDANEPV